MSFSILSQYSEPASRMKLGFALHHIFSKFWSVAPVWVIYMISKGYTLRQISIVDIAFYGAILIFELPTGVIADKFGRKTSLIVAYTLQGLALLYFSFAQSIVTFILSFAVWGLGMTMVSGAEEAWIYDECEYYYEKVDEEYQSFYGKLKAIGLITTTLAYLAGGLLAEISLSLPIQVNAIFFLISAVFLLVIQEHRQPTGQEEKSKTSMYKVITRPVLLILMGISVLTTGVVTVMIFWMQPFLDTFAISYSIIGAVLSSGVFFAAIGSYLSKQLTDYFDQKMMPAIFVGLGTVAFLLSQSPFVAIIGFFLAIRFIRGVFLPYFSSLVNADFSQEFRASALSIISAVSTIGIILMQYSSATLIEFFSYRFFYAISGIGILVLLLPLSLLYVVKSRQRHESPKKADSVGHKRDKDETNISVS